MVAAVVVAAASTPSLVSVSYARSDASSGDDEEHTVERSDEAGAGRGCDARPGTVLLLFRNESEDDDDDDHAALLLL